MRSTIRTVVQIVVSVGALCLATSLLLKGNEPEQFSDWGTPVNLGPIVNSSPGDFFPFISKDGLSLYFSSNRPGGHGGWDIWVSHRASVDAPWGSPENLDTINTPFDEVAPSLSPDGHLMYFASTRPVDVNGTASFGGNDIFVARRHNKRDDSDWQPAENLGAGVNTQFNESGPAIFEDDRTGVITLYFDSNRDTGLGPFNSDAVHNGNDIYASVLQRDGAFREAALVENVNTTSIERKVSIRRDGLEMFLSSDRLGSLTNNGVPTLDLWVSTRASTSDPWPDPINVGPVVNSGQVSPFTGTDAGPALSFDGKTLYFQSNRPGVVGLLDLYASTRSKLKGD